MNYKKQYIINIFIFVFSCASIERVFAVDPYDNWPNPPGGYAVTYPLYYAADRLTDGKGNTLISNLNARQYGNVFRYVYYGTKNPEFAWLINFLIPAYKKEVLNQNDSGIGDARFSTGFWIVNNQRKNIYFGPGIDVDIPTGHFEKTNLASVGDGVWRFRPVFVFAKFSAPFDVEATVRYSMATENSDTKLRKGDQFIFENFCGMFLNRRVMIGAHFNSLIGQNDKLNGNTVFSSAVRRFQVGPNIQCVLNQRFNVMFQFLKDFSTKNTTEGDLFLSRLVFKF